MSTFPSKEEEVKQQVQSMNCQKYQSVYLLQPLRFVGHPLLSCSHTVFKRCGTYAAVSTARVQISARRLWVYISETTRVVRQSCAVGFSKHTEEEPPKNTD